MNFYLTKIKLSENISKTEEGYLLCKNVRVGHTGPLKYHKGQHPIKDFEEITVIRVPEDFLSLKTMASFEGKPITIGHPNEFVNPENYQQLANGNMVNVRAGELEDMVNIDGEMYPTMMCDLLFKTKDAIELVQVEGERELSLGYICVWTVVDHEKAIVVQSELRGNHIALIPNGTGRAGIQCRVIDSKLTEDEMSYKEMAERFKKITGKSVEEAATDAEKAKETEVKDTEKLLAVALDSVEAMKKEIETLKGAATDAVKAKDEEEKKKKEAEDSDIKKAIDALSKRIDSLEKKKANDAEVEDEEEEEEGEDSEEDESEDSEEDESEDSEEDEDEKGSGKDSLEGVNDAYVLAKVINPKADKKSKTMVTDSIKHFASTKEGKKVLKDITMGKGLDCVNEHNEKFILKALANKAAASNGKLTKATGWGLDSSAESTDISPQGNAARVAKLQEDAKKYYGK